MRFYRIRCYAFTTVVCALLLGGSFASLRGSFLFVSVARSNLCETPWSRNCLSPEPGVVTEGDGAHEMTVVLRGGEPERVVAYDGWNETPPPGTSVVLERWEGDEIAYVSVPATGSRYAASGAPDRGSALFFALILAFLAVAIPIEIVRSSR